MDLIQISKAIATDIDSQIIEQSKEGHRRKLGASKIGEPCHRKLWFLFRWCVLEKFDARMHRLFEHGNLAEPRFINWLRNIGATVHSHHENGDQYKMSDLDGHFAGKLDGICILPPKYGIDEPILLECKTIGTGKPFTDAVKHGMSMEKPEHYIQACVYATDPQYNFRYCLYMLLNKNDDSLHVELISINKQVGKNIREKAKLIIYSQTPPDRVSKDAAYVKCKYCVANKVCHENAPPLRNCRSCRHASPAPDAQWQCAKYAMTIPLEYVPNGCEEYEQLCMS